MSTHEDRGRKPRSIDQHRRFFALMSALHSHWPESHSFQPDSSEHLRAWLLVRAKHCVINTFPLESKKEAEHFAKILPIITSLMLKKHSWCRTKGNELHVCVPLSINHAECSHALFTQVCADVDAIIKAETGLDPETLLREQENAA